MKYVLLLIVILFALAKEDGDAKACTDQGGTVYVDEYPNGSEYHVCQIGDKAVKVWQRINGENVLVWGS